MSTKKDEIILHIRVTLEDVLENTKPGPTASTHTAAEHDATAQRLRSAHPDTRRQLLEAVRDAATRQDALADKLVAELCREAYDVIARELDGQKVS